MHPLLAKVFRIPTHKIKLEQEELTEEELLNIFYEMTFKRNNKLLFTQPRWIPTAP